MSAKEYRYTDHQKADDLSHKTIESCTIVPAEYGRTFSRYTCIAFTDGSRVLIGGDWPVFNARPPIESMKAAPLFFSVQDIVDRVEEEETETRQWRARQQERELAEFKRLQKKYKGKADV